MQRFAGILIGLFVLVLALSGCGQQAATASAGAPEGKLGAAGGGTEEIALWEDGFESYPLGSFPSNWHVVYSGAGVDQQYVTDRNAFSGSQSFRVLGRTGWSSVMARNLTSTAPVIGFEYAVYFNGRASNYSDHPGFICESCSTWSTYWGVGFDHSNGEIHLASADGPLTIGYWEPYRWIRVKFIFDRERLLTNVWIDGEKVATDVPWPTGGADPYNIGGFAVTSAWPAREVFYDDIRVFEVTASDEDGEHHHEGRGGHFKLRLHPRRLSVPAGSAVDATLTVIPKGGFEGTVSLSVAARGREKDRDHGRFKEHALPKGITVSPDSVVVSGGEPTEQTVTIRVAPDADPGVYKLRLVGKAGEVERHINFDLEVGEPEEMPMIAYWSFDDCTGTDQSGNGYDLSGDFTGRCTDGVDGGTAATVVSISPQISCLAIPPIAELGTARQLSFDFWFRVRDLASWQTTYWSSHGTAFFSFGEQNTIGRPFFGFYEYPLSDYSGIRVFMEYDDVAFGQGSSSGVHNLTPQTQFEDENYHHVQIAIDRAVAQATLYLDGVEAGTVALTDDFDLLGGESGYLGAHSWWGGTNSCSASSLGPRATIDLDEFMIRGR